MQKVMIIDANSIDELNKLLDEAEFEITSVNANQSGQWLIVLDDENLEEFFGDEEFEEEEEEEEEVEQAPAALN